MMYFSLQETPEGGLLRGLSSSPGDLPLPPNCVDVETLLFPTAVAALGITTWEEFNQSGLTQFYVDTGEGLALRVISYFFETTNNFSSVKFAAVPDQVTVDPLGTVFLLSTYPEAQENPLTVYATANGVTYEGQTFQITESLNIYQWPWPPVPSGFTDLVPPVPTETSTPQWTGSEWLLSPFPIEFNLLQAKAFLTTLIGSEASNQINNQLRQYNTIEILNAPDVLNLRPADSETNGYTTIGEYKDAVDAETLPKYQEINNATNLNDLYSFDPTIPPPPPIPLTSGLLFTGRGSGLGPEDLNVSYYTEFNSTTLTESETELYVPGTNTVIPYGSGGPGKFDSMGNAFNPGDYFMQIRETSTGRVIGEFEVPLNPSGENVAF